jgi:hypothetical protein
MAKTKISEFSATPANNTDIDGININEGCAPSGINDAIRELMAQLKDFQTGAVGDSFNGPVGTTTAAAGAFTTLSASSTVSGTGFSTYLASPPAIGGTAAAAGSFTTLSASGAVTLSGGTANGVAYLNGSKVVTSGSALQFDGNNFGVGGTPNGYGSTYTVATINNATDGAVLDLNLAGTRRATFFTTTVEARIGSITNIPFSFYQNNSEQMRLTSTGLGIGTSSPFYKLDVNGAVHVGGMSGTTGNKLYFDTTSNAGANTIGTVNNYDLRIECGRGATSAFTAATNSLQFEIGASEVGRFTSTGLGVGTSSPAVKLETAGLSNGATLELLRLNNAGSGASTAGQIVFRAAGTNYADIIGGYGSASARLSFNVAAGGYQSFAIGGSDKLTLDSSGNLGLGVAPSAWSGYQALQIGSAGGLSMFGYSNAAEFGNNYYYNAGYKYGATASSTNYVQTAGQHRWFNAPSGTAGNAITFTQAMTLDASGNLGIGTTSPATKLQVNSTAPAIRIQETTTGGDKRLELGVTSGGQAYIGANQSAQSLQFQTVGSTQMTLDASGNLALTKIALNSDSPFITGANISSGTNPVALGTTGSANIHFFTANSERMRLDSSGNLGIGTSSPSSKFVVSNAGAAGFEINPTGSASAPAIYSYNRNTSAYDILTSISSEARWQTGSSPTERMRIDSSGNLLVGTTGQIDNERFSSVTTGTAAYFKTSGTSQTVTQFWNTATSGTIYQAIFRDGASATARGSIATDGSATAYNTSSDYRLKENIVDLPNALATVAQLKPRQFDWKETGNTTTGFIAHELAEVCPHAVTGEKDAVDENGNPKYQGIDTSFLVATLTAALQEAHGLIKSLEARVVALEAK